MSLKVDCRICGGTDLYRFLDLGFTPLADQFKTSAQLEQEEVWYPLAVNLCRQCGMVQLSHVVPPDILYCNDYPYESSTTATGRSHWNGFAESVVARFGLTERDLVVDIGSNVGALLHAFTVQNCRVHGIDPAPNLCEIANANGIPTSCGFFSQPIVDAVVKSNGQASIVTGTNVFAHVDDLKSFVQTVMALLKPEGVLVLEFPYLIPLLDDIEYDTIYHEHLSYFSIRPLTILFEQFGMELFDVEDKSIHGGSARIFVAHKGQHATTPAVRAKLDQEHAAGVYGPERFDQFASAVAAHRQALRGMLCDLKRQGKSICAVSAPAKGMTLLNYSGIRRETLDFVTEKSALKIGRFTPGGHLPVLPDAELLTRKPDYALLLAWNFSTEIIRNLSEYQQGGGKFIIPIPTPRIVG